MDEEEEDEEIEGREFDNNVWEANDTLDAIMEVGPYSLEFYLDCNHQEDDDDMDDDDMDEDDMDEDDDEEDEPKRPARKDKNKDKKGKSSKKNSESNINPDGKGGEQECKQN